MERGGRDWKRVERNGDMWRGLGRSDMMGGGDWRDGRGLEWIRGDWKGLEGKVTGEERGAEGSGVEGRRLEGRRLAGIPMEETGREVKS